MSLWKTRKEHWILSALSPPSFLQINPCPSTSGSPGLQTATYHQTKYGTVHWVSIFFFWGPLHTVVKQSKSWTDIITKRRFTILHIFHMPLYSKTILFHYFLKSLDIMLILIISSKLDLQLGDAVLSYGPSEYLKWFMLDVGWARPRGDYISIHINIRGLNIRMCCFPIQCQIWPDLLTPRALSEQCPYGECQTMSKGWAVTVCAPASEN